MSQSGSSLGAPRGAPPYGSSAEHLRDELCRIDQLVRAQTRRWQLTLAATKPENLWGMVHVTDAEVQAYLNAPFELLPPLPPDEHLKRHLRQAEALLAEIAARLGATPQLTRNSFPLVRLQNLFGLSSIQKDVLLVCLLPEIDARYRRLFGYLQDDVSRARPTVELVLQIVQLPALGPAMPPDAVVRHLQQGRSALEPGGALLAGRLMHLGGAGGDEPLPARFLRLDDRVADYVLNGQLLFDGRLAGVLTLVEQLAPGADLRASPDQVVRLRKLAEWADRRRRRGEGTTLFLHGPYGSGRRAAAQAVCAHIKARLFQVEVGRALRAPGGWEQAVDLSYREASLRAAALYWSGCEALLGPDQPAHAWDYLVAAAEAYWGLTFLASETAWDPVGRFRDGQFVRLEFAMPGYELRRQLWEDLLTPYLPDAGERGPLAETLANSFQLTEGQARDALATALGLALGRDAADPRLTADDLYEGCRRQSGRYLGTLAQRLKPRPDLSLDQLILPEASLRQLQELRDRIRNRSRVFSGLGFERRLLLGKGLLVLFTGAPGTGKTMAAELLANDQKVDLYKIDLSAVVSKWVGETEKHLNRVFAEAEDANAILFFDEGEALFGKRGEVKDARDRWANLEVNYLLQRVEEYAGVVILASNLRQNIDEAFLRRLHVIVDFPFPDRGLCLRIWRHLFPPEVARPSDEELRELADRFGLAGGSIRNVVIDAAFRAVAQARGEPPVLTQRHLAAAVAREYQKMGKPITAGEFGPALYPWVQEDILSERPQAG